MATDAPRVGLFSAALSGALAAGVLGALEATALVFKSGDPSLDLVVLTEALMGYTIVGGVGAAVLYPLAVLGGRAIGGSFLPWPWRVETSAAARFLWLASCFLFWAAAIFASDLMRLLIGGPPRAAVLFVALVAGLGGAWFAGWLVLPTQKARERAPNAAVLAILLGSWFALVHGGRELLERYAYSTEDMPAHAALAFAPDLSLGFSTKDYPENWGPPIPPPDGYSGLSRGLITLVEVPPRPRDSGRDVVLISLDTTRWDHLTPYGYDRDTTPRLQEFAEESVRYERAFATTSWTLPTHASMFTGLFARRHGAHFSDEDGEDRVQPLDPVHLTLAEILQGWGYRTGGFVAGPYIAAGLGVAKGFDWYDDRIHVSVGPMLALYGWLDRFVEHLEPDWFDFAHGYRRAEDIERCARSWMETAGEDERLFLFANFFDAHGPLWPVASVRDRYPGAELDWDRERLDAVYQAAMRSGAPIPDDAVRWMKSQYDAELRYQDASMGRLFDWLRAEGRWEEALVIVVADHGEHLGERGLIGHGFTIYPAVTRIPLLVKFPASLGIEPGVREEVAHQVDLLPTVLDALGMGGARDWAAEHLDGRSLLDEARQPRALLELYPDPFRFNTFGDQWRQERAGWVEGDALYLSARPPGGDWQGELVGNDAHGSALEDPGLSQRLRAELTSTLEELVPHPPSPYLQAFQGGANEAALSATGYAGEE